MRGIEGGKQRAAGRGRRRNQADLPGGPGARGKLHLRHGDGERGVSDDRGGRLGNRARGGRRGDAGWRRGRGDGRYQGDGGRDVCDDARVLGHEGAADAGEVGERGLDVLVGGAPGADAGDDFGGEGLVGAEAADVAVGGAFGHQGEPGVDAFGDGVGAWGGWRWGGGWRGFWVGGRGALGAEGGGGGLGDG